MAARSRCGNRAPLLVLRYPGCHLVRLSCRSSYSMGRSCTKRDRYGRSAQALICALKETALEHSLITNQVVTRKGMPASIPVASVLRISRASITEDFESER